MKKGFWGYRAQDVDDAMDLLESQNATLTKRNLHLEAELQELRTKLAELEAGDAQETEAQEAVQKLQGQMSSLELEKKSWRERAEVAEAQLTMLEARQNDLERVSAICREAYADMSAAKQHTREKMEESVEMFMRQWEAAQQEMQELFGEIGGLRENVREAFIAAADDILTRFDELSAESQGLQEKWRGMDAARTDILRQFDAVLDTLRDEVEPEQVEAAAESAAQEAERPAILRAISERNRQAERQPMVTALRDVQEEAVEEAPVIPGTIGISVGISPRSVINK